MTKSAGLPVFSADLRTPEKLEPGYPLPFTSLEAACCDVYESMPQSAADLLRDGIDPMTCAYIVCDAEGTPLVEIAFVDLLRDRPCHGLARERADGDWLGITEDLRVRSAAAIGRMERASAWMNRLAARALEITAHPDAGDCASLRR